MPRNIVKRRVYVSNALEWYDVEDRNVYYHMVD